MRHSIVHSLGTNQSGFASKDSDRVSFKKYPLISHKLVRTKEHKAPYHTCLSHISNKGALLYTGLSPLSWNYLLISVSMRRGQGVVATTSRPWEAHSVIPYFGVSVIYIHPFLSSYILNYIYITQSSLAIAKLP